MEDIITTTLNYGKLVEMSSEEFANYVKNDINYLENSGDVYKARKIIYRQNDFYVNVGVDNGRMVTIYTFKKRNKEFYSNVVTIGEFFMMKKLFEGEFL